MKLFIILALIQGPYYFLTGIWCIVDIKSFMLVTGPKTDIWLVKTVSVLIIVISLVFIDAGIRKNVSRETLLLAVGSAVGLIIIDVYYTAINRISSVYLMDALAQFLLLIGWMIAYYKVRYKKSNIFKESTSTG
jgi:hypothetical protein